MTRAEPPLFFSDRDPITVLERHADRILSAMSEWGIGRIGEHKTVHFCGLIYHPEEGPVIFLPREARIGDSVIDLQTASLSMNALARFGAETSLRDFEDDGDTGNPGMLSVIKRLSNDFRDHGLYAERIRRQTRNSGKPDWRNTIKREMAMPDHNGHPVFTDIHTSRAIKSSDTLLARIQAAVLREIHLAHAWWLRGTSGRTQELRLCPNPPFPRTSWTSNLDALLPSLYSSRSIFLAKYLRFYLRETRKSSNGTLVFGVSDFHSVWETMLRETIVRSPYDTRRNWNSILPKPFYILKGSNKYDPRKRGMQTDIILENETDFTIVDAKYYAAKDAETAPGWPDIAKQMFYEQALLELVASMETPQSQVTNIFAFPGQTNDGPLASVEIRHTDGSPVSTTFKPIECVYVSMHEALIHYAHNTQGIKLL